MTRKQAIFHERILRGMGVYKPYVSTADDLMYIESYPLTAIVKNSPVDPERGPCHAVKITDASLARENADSTLTTLRVFIGQDLLRVVGQLLMDFHGPAYERAQAQDAQAGIEGRRK